MIKNIKSALKKVLIKPHTLETFTIDDVVYKVVDVTSILPNIKNTRRLLFKKDDHIYNHSSIYINPKHHVQPSLAIPQKIISIWSKSYSLNNALVLGCAGCSVPRFIGLHFPKSKTVGVELSEDFINIAKKHFLLDQIKNQFELVQGDAIHFVKNYNLDYKQNIIFVDIFCENQIVPDVFTESFIDAAYNITDENGVIIINILGQDIDNAKAIMKDMNIPFKNIVAIKHGASQFLILTKSTDIQKENEFINNLKAEKMSLF